MIIPPGPLASAATAALPPQYTIEATLAGGVKVTNLSKSQVYFLPSSYKGHITLQLLAKIEAFCDTRPNTGGVTMFYASVQYADRANPTQLRGKILKLSEAEVADRISTLGLNGLSNAEATKDLINVLFRGEFHTPSQIRYIHQLLDSGASEAPIVDALNQIDDLSKFVFAYELLSRRNGSLDADPILISNYTFLKSLDSLDIHDSLLVYSHSLAGAMSIPDIIKYKLLSSPNTDEYNQRIAECQNLTSVESIKSYLFSMPIPINVHKDFDHNIFLNQVMDASSIVDLEKLLTKLRDLQWDKTTSIYHAFPYVSDLHHIINSSIAAAENIRKKDSFLSDTVIKIGNELIYTNANKLAEKYTLFGDASPFPVSTDAMGRKVYDLTEVGKNERGILKELKCTLEDTPLPTDGVSAYTRYRGMQQLGARPAFLPPDTLLSNFQGVDNLVSFFEKGDEVSIRQYFHNLSRTSPLSIPRIAFQYCHPNLFNDLNREELMADTRGMPLLLASTLLQMAASEPLFKPETFSQLLDGLHPEKNDLELTDGFPPPYAKIRNYYLLRAADLNSPHIHDYAPHVGDALVENRSERDRVREACLQQMKLNPSLNNISLIIDGKTYVTNENFIQMVGGRLLNASISFLKDTTGASGVYDLTEIAKENPEAFKIIIKELISPKEVSVSSMSLTNRFLLEEQYDYVGLPINAMHPLAREILRLYAASDFDNLSKVIEGLDAAHQIRIKTFVCNLVKADLHSDPTRISENQKLIELIHQGWVMALFDERRPERKLERVSAAAKAAVELDVIDDPDEILYLSLHGLDPKVIDPRYYRSLQKIAHMGNAATYTYEEIDELLNCTEALPFLINITNRTINTPLSDLISERMILKFSVLDGKLIKSSKEKNFLRAFKENMKNMQVINYSAVYFGNESSFKHLLTDIKNPEAVHLPSVPTHLTRAAGEFEQQFFSKATGLNRCTLVSTQLPTYARGREVVPLIIKSQSPGESLVNNPKFEDITFRGNGTKYKAHNVGFNIFMSLMMNPHKLVSKIIKFENYIINNIDTFFTIRNSLIFENCDIQYLNLNEAPTLLRFENCNGNFLVTVRGVLLNRVELFHTSITEDQLVALANQSKKILIDRLPAISPSNWALIRDKVEVLDI